MTVVKETNFAGHKVYPKILFVHWIITQSQACQRTGSGKALASLTKSVGQKKVPFPVKQHGFV